MAINVQGQLIFSRKTGLKTTTLIEL